MIELLFGDEFGLSGSEISEEKGKEAYCYRGEGCLTKELVEEFRLVASLWMNQRAIE